MEELSEKLRKSEVHHTYKMIGNVEKECGQFI